MKRIILLAVICATAVSLNAKSVTNHFRQYEMPGLKSICNIATPKGYEKVTKNGITTLVEKKENMSRSLILRGGVTPPPSEDGIAVKGVFNCDMESWTPRQIVAFNKETYKEVYYEDWEKDFVTLNLEAGKYDFLAIFAKNDATSIFQSSYEAWVIKEGVEISAETTISFDPTTATNHISMRSYNPNGESSRLRRIKYTDEDYNYDIIEEYNVIDVKVDKSIYHEDYGEVYSLNTNLMLEIDLNPACPQMGQWKGEEWVGDFYVNDVSNKYMFQQFRIMYTDDETFSTVIRAKGGKTQSATNDYTKYREPIKYKFVNTPASKKYNEEYNDATYGMTYFSTYNKKLPHFMFGLNSSIDAIHTISFCPPTTVPEYDDIIDFGFSFRHVDAVKNDTIDFGDGEVYVWQKIFHVISQNVFPHADKNEYVYSANTSWLDSPKVGEIHYALPGPQGLNFNFSETAHVMASTCPFAMTYYLDYPMGESNIPIWGTIYKGYMGETREVDDADATIELKANDQIIATNSEELDAWMYSEEHTPAKLMFSMTNQNVEIDGIDGRNDMVCVVDQTKDDHYVPVLTAVQFRAADGFVTDRFRSGEGGILTIMCGDFNQKFDKNGEFWFEYSDCDLTVEYAPNGTDNYKDIEMTKDDSKFYMPGYGAYYNASLAGVVEPSSNGWYDLRITLKDEAGNYQTQKFGPAFKIDSPTGIAGTSVDHLATVKAIYNIAGIKLNKMEPGINICEMSDGSYRKILVK